jgi:MFS family permease
MATDVSVPLRRNRDFMLLWVTQVVSTVGTRITSVAYPLLVLAITGSPADAGVVGFAQTLPFLLLYLPAGAYVDRWSRRRMMILCEAGRAVALGSIALAVALDHVSLAQIIVVAFIEGSLFVFFDLGEGAALPHIVTTEQLPAALAQNQARMQGADIVGQPLGGVLFSVSRGLPFVADSISYLLSLAGLLLIRRPFQHARPATVGSTRLRTEIAEGLRAVWHQPFLRSAVGLVGGMNFVFNAMTLVLIVRAKDFGASAAVIGLMFMFFGVGGLLGALIAPWVHRRFTSRTVVVAIAWAWCIQMALLVLMPNPWALGALSGIGALGGAPFNVVINSELYRVTPDRLLGRVRSTAKLVAWGSIPFGALVAGVLISAFGAGRTFLVLAAVMIAVAIAASFTAGMRVIGTEDI